MEHFHLLLFFWSEVLLFIPGVLPLSAGSIGMCRYAQQQISILKKIKQQQQKQCHMSVLLVI